MHGNRTCARLASSSTATRLRFSPDAGDALALTFAEPVRRKGDIHNLPTRANSSFNPHRWRQHA
jgi:hypothetical protein